MRRDRRVFRDIRAFELRAGGRAIGLRRLFNAHLKNTPLRGGDETCAICIVDFDDDTGATGATGHTGTRSITT